jgi:hypothetical protein
MQHRQCVGGDGAFGGINSQASAAKARISVIEEFLQVKAFHLGDIV